MVLFFLVFRFKCVRFFVEAPTAEQTYRGVKERYLRACLHGVGDPGLVG